MDSIELAALIEGRPGVPHALVEAERVKEFFDQHHVS